MEIYRNKRIMVTGHTGFKGSWITIWLKNLGAEILGYSLDPIYENSCFELSGIGNNINDVRGDIRDYDKLCEVVKDFQPQFVFHLAAQPLVGKSYNEPLYTYDVNVMGSVNVMNATLLSTDLEGVVIVTTDKCYSNHNEIWPFRENDRLGGYDPYSSSKAAVEIAVDSWRDSFYKERGVPISTVRAGNVIGGGDWADNRLIPDIFKSYIGNNDIVLRNPTHIRPWQHVLEPLYGYLLLGKLMMENGTNFSSSYNFGPNISESYSVLEITELICQYLDYNGKLKVGLVNQFHESNTLKLDVSKAKTILGWTPTLDISNTIKLTCDWYKRFNSENVYELCVSQINYYVSLL